MAKFYNEEGEEVEGFTKEEVEIKTKEVVKPLEEKLKGFESKDYNFGILRDKVLKGEQLTEKEREVYEREKLVEEKEKSFQDKLTGSWKEKALKLYAGEDKEKEEKIKFIFDNDLKALDATTEEEIRIKVEKAATLVEGKRPKANPLSGVMGVSGTSPEPPDKDKSYADTEEGKNLANLMGIPIAPPEVKK